MKANPFITLIIPCFNCEKTIMETLDSVDKQTYPHKEVILVDDGSSDNTKRILEEYVTPRAHYFVFHQPNKGQASARNLGLSHAKGEYVVFVDSDDKIHPDFLEEFVQVFQQDATVNMVYSEMQTFDRENKIYNLREFKLSEFLITNCIPVFCMVRTEHIRAIGGFDENMDNNEDWECWIRMYKTFKGKVIKINKVLYFYRKRLEENSISDLSIKHQKVESSFKYVYDKHYAFYMENGLGIWDLFHAYIERGSSTSKYYSIWYKRLFYKIFNKKKYEAIAAAVPFCYLK